MHDAAVSHKCSINYKSGCPVVMRIFIPIRDCLRNLQSNLISRSHLHGFYVETEPTQDYAAVAAWSS